ncbi:MAG: succinate dehydrogenase, cytochrome b556 subunit [Gammaproteobacteria bacterium]|jgi:succinate dehydrogenase / fumarate reductase cytochrome b subunit|nr:succinate dehydrogenase, cytochrome b556 subunit [Gammaproteobacteria bacterium]
MIANLVYGENWLRTAEGSCILISRSRENNNGMETVKQRPVYLNLFKIRLPVGGVASIAHRVTGVLLVLLLPAAIYLLALSLESLAGFHKAIGFLTSIPGRIIVLLSVWLFAQHFFSGIRHLLLDIDIGIEKGAARAGAWLVFLATGVTVVVLGFWIL